MHTPGALAAKTVHPAVYPDFLSYIKVLICLKKHAHTGCTCAEICAPGSQNVCTGCRVHP